MQKTFGFWKTTILGGVFFLLPFAMVVFLIGQLAAVIFPVARQIQDYIPATNVLGYMSLATILACVLLIALCFLAGLAARKSVAARLTVRIEKYLLMLFPRYAILKDQMASNIGGDASRPQMKPVLVRLDDLARIGFEIERTATGVTTVYLPGSPDPWQGCVAHVAAERVTPLAADFGQAVAICETLGRGATPVIANLLAPDAGAATQTFVPQPPAGE